MKVTWQVEDGYCGPSRPQTTRIWSSVNDFDSFDEFLESVEEEVMENFRQTVYPVISQSSIRELEELFNNRDKENNDEDDDC